jgi:hypothetical protein
MDVGVILDGGHRVKKALTYIEIDVPYCSLVYGTAPCTASIPTTGSIKCFNSLGTCQDRVNFEESTVTLRFGIDHAYLPKDIDCIPSLRGVTHNPAELTIGSGLGTRATVTAVLGDHRHSDTGTGFDKYLADRSYNPVELGTFWGKFKARHPYMKGRSFRLIRGYLGQSLAEMKVRHFIIDSMSGPSADGSFQIVAKDALRLFDDNKARAPLITDLEVLNDINAAVLGVELTPSSDILAELGVTGFMAIGGEEIVEYEYDAGLDASTTLLLHCDGADASTTFTDSATAPHTVTRSGNAQIDTAQSKFGGASALFDGTGDFLSLDGSADFAFGTGDFCIDFWVRFNTIAAKQTLYDSTPSGGSGVHVRFYKENAGPFKLDVNGVTRIDTVTAIIGAGTWNHILLARRNGVTRLFINGIQRGLDYADTNNYVNGASRPVIGTNGNNTAIENFNGWMDEIRVSKGAFRHSFPFAPPAIAYAATGQSMVAIKRAQQGTVAAEHKAEDRVQKCLIYSGEDIADILYDLIVNYAGVPSSYITLDAWKSETENFLGQVYSTVIAESEGVATLVNEICEQAAVILWWDDVNAQIKLQVIRKVQITSEVLNNEITLRGSLSIADQPNRRVSQVWTYFGRIDPLESLTDEKNYKSVAVHVDLQSETDYGSAAIHRVFSRWIPRFARPIAERLNEILIARLNDPPRKFTLGLFNNGEHEITLGQARKITGTFLQDATGAQTEVEVQITRLVETDDQIAVQAEEMLFEGSAVDLDNRVIIIDANTVDFNLRTVHDTIYPVITTVGSITLKCIIEAGVIVGNQTDGLPAFNVGSWPVGLPITIEVRGRIQGRGGRGGRISDINGQAGTGALLTTRPITLISTDGEIWGGGGGGGAWSDTSNIKGGGGGSGYLSGAAGDYNGTVTRAPQAGTTEAGGLGGLAGSAEGGAGGGPGLAGTGVSTSLATSLGGAAGSAIDGLSHITFSGAPGDHRGTEIN